MKMIACWASLQVSSGFKKTRQAKEAICCPQAERIGLHLLSISAQPIFRHPRDDLLLRPFILCYSLCFRPSLTWTLHLIPFCCYQIHGLKKTDLTSVMSLFSCFAVLYCFPKEQIKPYSTYLIRRTLSSDNLHLRYTRNLLESDLTASMVPWYFFMVPV